MHFGDSSMKLSIIVPAYNEAKTLRTIVDKVKAVEMRMGIEIVVVDDCSSDDTPRILDELSKRDGIVKTVHCAKGSRVDAGAVLMELA